MSDTPASSNNADSGVTKTGHRYELDVLTSLIVFGLLFFHTASIFSGQQLIVNEEQGQVATMVASLIVSFEYIWIMPVMMCVAGMAMWYSLNRRTPGQFIRERLLRLGLPFFTGLVLANPPQVFYYLKAREGLTGGFFSFYPQFWNIKFSFLSFPYFLQPAGPEETFSVLHLWFIIFLLVYTLLLLPVFIALKKPAGERYRIGMSGFYSRSFALFLMAVPVALLEGFGGAIWPSGWNRWIWPIIILFGFITAGDKRLMSAFVRHRITALIIGLIGFIVFFMGMGLLFGQGIDPWTGREQPAVILRLIKGVSSWCLTVAVIGIATRLGEKRAEKTENPGQRTAPSRFTAYCREAQLPVYILHQTPIIILGYYVVGFNWQPLGKFLLIFLGSAAAVLIVYDLLIRRIGVLRLLFGMRRSMQRAGTHPQEQ